MVTSSETRKNQFRLPTMSNTARLAAQARSRGRAGGELRLAHAEQPGLRAHSRVTMTRRIVG
jgi:hypothetical protein